MKKNIKKTIFIYIIIALVSLIFLLSIEVSDRSLGRQQKLAELIASETMELARKNDYLDFKNFYIEHKKANLSFNYILNPNLKVWKDLLIKENYDKYLLIMVVRDKSTKNNVYIGVKYKNKEFKGVVLKDFPLMPF